MTSDVSISPSAPAAPAVSFSIPPSAPGAPAPNVRPLDRPRTLFSQSMAMTSTRRGRQSDDSAHQSRRHRSPSRSARVSSRSHRLPPPQPGAAPVLLRNPSPMPAEGGFAPPRNRLSSTHSIDRHHKPCTGKRTHSLIRSHWDSACNTSTHSWGAQVSGETSPLSAGRRRGRGPDPFIHSAYTC